jgi:hypothetical protein
MMVVLLMGLMLGWLEIGKIEKAGGVENEGLMSCYISELREHDEQRNATFYFI